MSTAKRLAVIAAGYVLAFVGGLAAVALNEWRMPADISQGSPGMVAFGDMILFVLAAGFLALVPTFLLLKLAVEKIPRLVLAAVLLLAVLGPASWIAVLALAGRGPPAPNQTIEPAAVAQLFGLFIAFGAIPRIVAGPAVVAIEGVTILLVRARRARAFLVAAMLMDIVPLGLFALHMARH